jgi:outer membrane protein
MIRVIFIAVLSFCFVRVSAQGEWSLQQCVDYAIKNNIYLKQAELNSQINKNNTLQSKASVLPSVNAGAAHTYNFGRTIDRYTNTFANTQVLSQNFYVSSNLILWSGLSQFNNIKANEYNYKAGVENVKQQENDLALNVATAYINVIYADELSLIAKNQYDITKQQLDRTQKLANAGTLAKSAVFDIEAQLANEEVNVTNADNNYQIAFLTLKQLMNLDSAGFKIVKPDLEVQAANLVENSVQNIYETALKTQPSIKATDYNVLMADKTLAAAKGRVSPTISMNASIGSGYSGLAKDITGYNVVNDTLGDIPGFGPLVYQREDPILRNTPFADQFKNNVNKSFGFTLTVPIFNGLQTYTSVKNAKIGKLNAQYTKELAEQNLYKTIAQAYANARAALNKYSASKSSVEASQQSFNFAQQKFNVGAISAFDFSTAKSRLVNAQSTLLQAKYDYLFKLKVLDYYQGKPLSF